MSVFEKEKLYFLGYHVFKICMYFYGTKLAKNRYYFRFRVQLIFRPPPPVIFFPGSCAFWGQNQP